MFHADDRGSSAPDSPWLRSTCPPQASHASTQRLAGVAPEDARAREMLKHVLKCLGDTRDTLW